MAARSLPLMFHPVAQLTNQPSINKEPSSEGFFIVYILQIGKTTLRLAYNINNNGETMKRTIRLKKQKQKGFAILLVAALISAMAILALEATSYLANERGQVWQAIGQANGLIIGASGITKKNQGVFPCSASDFGVQALPGSTYASFTVSSACHIIVTFGDTNHGAQQTTYHAIQDAVIDYAPTFTQDGTLYYTCTVDNSFFKQFFSITQCAQKAPVTAGNQSSSTTSSS